jgi:adenine/guanine phosphoribosyltransferase-like PRPP-binding protein
LVDDVLTTGATIEAAASLCARHGAASVSAITFAQKTYYAKKDNGLGAATNLCGYQALRNSMTVRRLS